MKPINMWYDQWCQGEIDEYDQLVRNMHHNGLLGGVWFAEWNSLELEFIKEFDFEEIGMEFDGI